MNIFWWNLLFVCFLLCFCLFVWFLLSTDDSFRLIAFFHLLKRVLRHWDFAIVFAPLRFYHLMKIVFAPMSFCYLLKISFGPMSFCYLSMLGFVTILFCFLLMIAFAPNYCSCYRLKIIVFFQCVVFALYWR